MFSRCALWPTGSSLSLTRNSIFFFSINQTTSTFSLKPLVGATLALKALLNSRSSLPLASDDVMTYTPLPGRWYPHSLKNEGENIKEHNCLVNAYASYINDL